MKKRFYISLILFLFGLSQLQALTKEEKSGAIIGFEGNLAGVEFGNPMRFVEANQWGPSRWHDLYEDLEPDKKYSFSFDGGVKLGYQHYFINSLGFRTSGYFGIGSLKKRMSFADPSNKNNKDSYCNDYLLVKTGFDIDFLWDFWEKGNHTLGLNLGMGYRYTHFDIKNSSIKLFALQGSNMFFSSTAISPINMHVFYPSFGLHYYYKQHQFEISYRFGGIIQFKGQEIMMTVSPPSYEGIMFRNDLLSTPNYLSFSYTYRF